VRTTIDISDEAWHIAKAVAREQNRSLGSVVSDFIVGRYQPAPAKASSSKSPFPSFRCVRRVTTADVEAQEDE
jgi:hypothetical protein